MRRFVRRVNVPAVLGLVLALNGFLNLATGLVPLFAVARYVEELPEYLRVTPVQRTSGVASLLLGILLVAIGKGLYERRRRSWRAALVVLALLMANNLYRGTTPQTAILSASLIGALVLFRRRFDVSSRARFGYAQIIALASVTFALGYGIVGSYVLREQFEGLGTWSDAVYFTFVTYSTLGYGDILPVTENAKLFATTMIPIGLASFVTALSVLVGPAIEKRVKGVLSIMERIHQVRNHVVVCGYSNVSETTIDELQSRDVPYLIVDDREGLLRQLKSKGHDVLAGDPTRREVLEMANLRNASAVIGAFDSDSVNILVAVTARELREATKDAKFRILVRVENEENIEKARHVGADEVISPSTMAGKFLAERASEPRQASG